MAGKYTREMHEEYRRQRDEQVAKEEQERTERVEKTAALRQWRRDGGDEASFERAWPTLRDEARRKRVADIDQRARQQQRATGVSNI